MALVDLSKSREVYGPTAEELYITRHYNAVYEARRARDQQRHRHSGATEPLSQAPEPETGEGTSASRARITADVLQTRPVLIPERRHSLNEMARRLTGKAKRRHGG